MSFQPNETILNGKYIILKLLGEGGMARVWLAREEQFAGRLVAIKEPKDNLPQDERYELERRFRQEILVAKMLQEAGAQHVVPVYTVEKVDDGHKVLVMKYMAGGDLARRIREHRRGMPIEDVVRIVADICRGLAVAHSDEVDIVHRDIKPSNILFDEQNQAYVADFGLAQLSGMSSRSVGVGQAHPGTPVYMAPEQARSPEPLTPAADVYALGCVLFEMLTGKRYKRVRPGTRVRELRPDVPQWLDEVVWRCVQEEPWDRYEDAGEVLVVLEEGETQVKEPPQWAAWYEAGKAALERGAWGEAIEALEALVAEAPEYRDAAQLLERARTKLEQQRAERAWQERLAALYREGQEVLAQGKWAKAIEALEALLREAPDYKDAKVLLARAKQGQEEERRRQKRWAELYEQGKAALERGAWGEAKEALEALVAEAPEYRDAAQMLERARGGEKQRRWEEAIKTLKQRFGMEFVRVPAGEFIMGSPEGEGDDDEHPQHRVYLDEYWIGKTEVTNAQYKHFIDARGYEQRKYWTDAGWQWRQKNHITQPRFWDDSKWNQADYPVVGVSWYEAVAFTRWLSEATGVEVRLPTEAEWEKAARGTDGRRYPWGDEWDPSRCNSREQGPIGITPVSMYPEGASPYGALDMAGNVWEWVSSLYKPYPYRADDGREEMESSECCRVVRGGSWVTDRWHVRAANRGSIDPVYRDDFLGFRVLVAAPEE